MQYNHLLSLSLEFEKVLHSTRAPIQHFQLILKLNVYLISHKWIQPNSRVMSWVVCVLRSNKLKFQYFMQMIVKVLFSLRFFVFSLEHIHLNDRFMDATL